MNDDRMRNILKSILSNQIKSISIKIDIDAPKTNSVNFSVHLMLIAIENAKCLKFDSKHIIAFSISCGSV